MQFFGDFRKKLKMFLLIATSIFNIFVIFLVLVDSLKRVDSKNTEFLNSSMIFRWFNSPRSKNGTKSEIFLLDIFGYHDYIFQLLRNFLVLTSR